MSLLFLSMYEFTEADLKSNQRGFITPSQKKWMEGLASGIRSSQNGAMKWGVFFLAFGLGLIFFLFLSAESYRKALFTDPLSFAPILCIPPVVLAVFALSIYLARRRAEQLINSDLLQAEGSVRLDESHSRIGTTYHLYVGGTRFDFPEEVGSIFKEGTRFRLYYCQTSFLKIILSYEKLASN